MSAASSILPSSLPASWITALPAAPLAMPITQSLVLVSPSTWGACGWVQRPGAACVCGASHAALGVPQGGTCGRGAGHWVVTSFNQRRRHTELRAGTTDAASTTPPLPRPATRGCRAGTHGVGRAHPP